MSPQATTAEIAEALAQARRHLLSLRTDEGYWEGRLSSSALATATAVSTLALACDRADTKLLTQAVRWLAADQNEDGGWGDTPDSPSNLSTTLLVASALTLNGDTAASAGSLGRARVYLRAQAGEGPAAIASAVTALYADDRTFAVPILMNCALAGLVEWSQIPSLPYQLAILPRAWYHALGLQVVSYALPALIAVGMALEYHKSVRSPGSMLRRAVTPVGRRKLVELQPPSGGFLEATPLTAFVTMSLLSLGWGDDAVVRQGLGFLRESARADGSWPIDTNLSVWLTSLASRALSFAGGEDEPEMERTRRWLAQRQYRQPHLFTGAAPGGWGWSHLSGAVPDADDTAGALLALSGHLDADAHAAGVRWLLDLQNANGGWPTFCRGWGRLPFDQSCADITAHVLRALTVSPQADDAPIRQAMERGLNFLRSRQRSDGSWVPLWFGNQAAPDHLNPVLGTARVLPALARLEPAGPIAARGCAFLTEAQNEDDGWGGAAALPSTVEETALAVTALSAWPDDHAEAVARGAQYLIERMRSGEWTRPSPIGLYFASLWYSEKLYPAIWTVEAMGKALTALAP
jgi:squalene-hopene/tetraprenyl-beta-curcumene cyclase